MEEQDEVRWTDFEEREMKRMEGWTEGGESIHEGSEGARRRRRRRRRKMCWGISSRAPQRPAPRPTVMERGREHHAPQGGGGREGGERESGTVRYEDNNEQKQEMREIPDSTNRK
ncbi:Hypothetical predicted protein [Xyrichtys novacula]|uniref:Uncharacterized protein n=1 Tax=Xyrichtys novacula TaxID=13765 RepID=A0AAV1FCY0_XYRNO|nr:Hypothetical predicted protein [Xyrichtys novacula]